MPKPVESSQYSPSERALSALHAYHRACALTGSLYQLSDCVKLPATLQPLYLAEIVLRAISESHVAIALAGDTTSDPAAVAQALYTEIQRTFSLRIAQDVHFRVAALMRGELAAAADGSK